MSMGEPALQLVEVNKELAVDKKAMTYADMIKALPVIRTPEEYLYVGQLWQQGRELLKEIDEGYDDLVKAAHKLHKDAVAKKARYYVPTEAGVKSAKALMSTYDAEQERIRKAEQDRLAAIARKAEEERLLQEAAAVEAEARANGATKEEAAQQADAVIAEPVYVAPIIVAKATPKLAGGPVFQTRWDFDVVNEALIPRQFLAVDMVKIRQIVTAMKGQTAIPGVRAFEKRV
jgi:hypothetical protein